MPTSLCKYSIILIKFTTSLLILTCQWYRRDLFGGDEVEVVPHHSENVRQGTIEIVVKPNAVIIKSHAKFDILPKPIESDSDALIQFHTTTTETITLQQKRDASTTLLKEKKTNMTGWRTLAIRPAYYEKIPSSH
jgi:hypothetical protein